MFRPMAIHPKELGYACSHCKKGTTVFIMHHLLIENGEVRRCLDCGKHTIVTTDGKDFNRDRDFNKGE